MQVNALRVRKQVASLVSAKAGRKFARVAPQSDLFQVGLDELDLVEVILEVERKFNVTIPDEVPLKTINDFVQFLCGAELKQAG